jgi:hypothetical protein
LCTRISNGYRKAVTPGSAEYLIEKKFAPPWIF